MIQRRVVPAVAAATHARDEVIVQRVEQRIHCNRDRRDLKEERVNDGTCRDEHEAGRPNKENPLWPPHEVDIGVNKHDRDRDHHA